MDLDRVYRIAGDLMYAHLIRDGIYGWVLTWDNSKTRAGACHYGTKRITLSRHLMALWNDEAAVRDVILHEIAHVLAGEKAGHGPEWKWQAAAVGAKPQRTHNGATVPARYRGTCSCREWERHRLTPSSRDGWCPACLWPITWIDVERGMPVQRAASAPQTPEEVTQMVQARREFSDALGALGMRPRRSR